MSTYVELSRPKYFSRPSPAFEGVAGFCFPLFVEPGVIGTYRELTGANGTKIISSAFHAPRSHAPLCLPFLCSDSLQLARICSGFAPKGQRTPETDKLFNYPSRPYLGSSLTPWTWTSAQPGPGGNVNEKSGPDKLTGELRVSPVRIVQVLYQGGPPTSNQPSSFSYLLSPTGFTRLNVFDVSTNPRVRKAASN
jgi:hypothetical protein